jgi:5'-3' exonuclease
MDYQDFLAQKFIVQDMFKALGITQVLNQKQEADDLITRLVFLLKKKYKEIIITSGDKDFHQLLSGDSVKIWNDSMKQFITEKNCKALFGYEAKQTVDYLSLLGDKSDNIPGYRGMGEKKSTELLSKYGSLQAFLDSNDKFPPIDRNKLLEVIQINRTLIDLSFYHSEYKNELTLDFIGGTSKPKVKLENFNAICRRFNLQKFMSGAFTKTFIDLWSLRK